MLVSKVGISSSTLSVNAYTFHIGTSKIALDVLTGVASEYLFNVGQTIEFLLDKYGNKMSPEVSLDCAPLGSTVRSRRLGLSGNYSIYVV